MKKPELSNILNLVSVISKASAAAVFMLDNSDTRLKLLIGSGINLNKNTPISLKKNSPEEAVLKTGKIQVVARTFSKSLKQHPVFLKNSRIESFICIPITIDNRNTGVIELYFNNPYNPDNKTLDIIARSSMEISLFIENAQLRKKTSLYSNLANIDGLTGLFNHKHFQELLRNELSRARRFKHPLTLLMLDLDHFKEYNDNYGHPAGDMVLQKTSKIIKNNLRSYDTCARYGGEEFSVILPHTRRHAGNMLAERIRKDISQFQFSSQHNKRNNITVSIGVAEFPLNAKSRNGLIERADQALYLAKAEGRNRVCSSLITSKELISLAFCPSAVEVFFSLIIEGMNEVIDDIGNIELTTFAPKIESHQQQLQSITQAINSNPDTLAVCCKTASLVDQVISKTSKANIPLILFHSLGVKKGVSKKIISSIGYDHRDAGKIVGTFLAKLLRSRGEVAILEGIPGQFDSVERNKGFLSIMKNYPEIHIVASMPCNWARTTARTVTSEIIKKYPGIDAIFAESDEMALGAFDALKNAGRQNRVFIVGIDGSQNVMKSIARGEITATLNTNPVEIGRIITRTVVRNLIKDEKIMKTILSPINIVSHENVDQYLMK